MAEKKVYKMMPKKSDYVVTIEREVIQQEKWLIKNETRKDAIWIAENMNQSKLYDVGFCRRSIPRAPKRRGWNDF